MRRLTNRSDKVDLDEYNVSERRLAKIDHLIKYADPELKKVDDWEFYNNNL